MNSFGNKHNYAYNSLLISKYKNTAFTIAFRIVKNEQDAEEVVQDSFIKAFQRLNTFRGESKFSTWFYRIVYHTAISRNRIKTLPLQHTENDDFETIDFTDVNQAITKLNQEDRKLLLQKAMEKLKESDFILLTLFYFEEKTLREIDFITGINRNYLKVLLQRARNKLFNSIHASVIAEIKELL